MQILREWASFFLARGYWTNWKKREPSPHNASLALGSDSAKARSDLPLRCPVTGVNVCLSPFKLVSISLAHIELHHFIFILNASYVFIDFGERKWGVLWTIWGSAGISRHHTVVGTAQWLKKTPIHWCGIWLEHSFLFCIWIFGYCLLFLLPWSCRVLSVFLIWDIIAWRNL